MVPNNGIGWNAPDDEAMMRRTMPRRSGDSERELQLDYHDPTADIGGAPPAASALTLRALLAGLGLTACLAGIALNRRWSVARCCSSSYLASLLSPQWLTC